MTALRKLAILIAIFVGVFVVDHFTGGHILHFLAHYDKIKEENEDVSKRRGLSQFISAGIHSVTDDGSKSDAGPNGGKIFETKRIFGMWVEEGSGRRLTLNQNGSFSADGVLEGEFTLPSGLKYSHSTSYVVGGIWSFDGSLISLAPKRLSNLKYTQMKSFPPQQGDPLAGKITIPSAEELAKQVPEDINKQILARLSKEPLGGKVKKAIYGTLHLEAHNGQLIKFRARI